MCAQSVSAQDIHFSQFYMSPLNLNPALTGVMNCNTRMVVNYRNQWATALNSDAFNTYSASYDQKIPVGRSDYFGIGGSLYGDVAGASRFGTTQGRLSLAYSKKMGGYRKKAHYLVIGADGGFAQRRIDRNALQYPNQHDGDGGFDPFLSSGEIFDQNGFLYPDVSAGLLWFSVFDQYNNFYVGASMSHLNQANQSFREDVFDPLFTRLTIHAGGQFSTTPKMSVLPGFIYFAQGPHRQFNFGTSLRFNLPVFKSQATCAVSVRTNSSFTVSIPFTFPSTTAFTQLIVPSITPDGPTITFPLQSTSPFRTPSILISLSVDTEPLITVPFANELIEPSPPLTVELPLFFAISFSFLPNMVSSFF